MRASKSVVPNLLSPTSGHRASGDDDRPNAALKAQAILSHEDEVFLTEHDLAARHKRSVKTLRNARVLGTYVRFVRIGRSIRYRLSDVLEYEATNLSRSTSDSPPANRDRQ